MSKLVIDAAKDKIFFMIINDDTTYNITYENNKINFEKMMILIKDFLDSKKIKIDDISRSFVRFKSGVSGSIEANWLATGCKMKHDFEIYGTKGAIRFSQERLNELYLFSLSDKKNIQGFRKIEAGPANKPYDRFCVAPGHQLGFNELKAIEISNFIKSINNEIPEPFNFASGHRIQKLVDAIHRSSKEKRWVMI